MATAERVYIDKALVDVADRLVKRQIAGSTEVGGVFAATRELAAFAAGLGYRKGHRKAVGEPGREIKLEALARLGGGGTDLVEVLAVAVARSVQILEDDKAQERATIFEEFMNGGLEHIQGFVNEDEGDVQAVIRLVRSEMRRYETDAEAVDLLGARL
ncbi:hypothetical protein [Gaopeijia maritima]|uniref:hypothetical protein n=1 Tax=Gaopeijia maritima TaxID=3119007 RepID=UPI003288C093